MMGLGRAQADLATVGVVARSARKHYGIELHVQYDEKIHEERKK